MENEKNIEILEKFVEETKNFENENGWHGYYDMELKAVREAIQNIMAEREQDKKKIQELEEHLKEFYNGELYTAKQLKNIERDKKKYYVHKSKIDELIKEMKENGTQYWARRLEKMEEK